MPAAAKQLMVTTKGLVAVKLLWFLEPSALLDARKSDVAVQYDRPDTSGWISGEGQN